MASDYLRNILVSLYWGSLKRPTRFIIRKLLNGSKSRILMGPLRGKYFSGQYPHRLGIYERSVEAVILDNLKVGRVFYDIGANIGYFSLLAAQVCGADGHVYCFEPVPDNVDRLRDNIANNSIYNYTIIDKAISDTNGTAQLVLVDGTKSSLNTSISGKTITVKLLTLDEFLKDNRFPQLVKIDVEGAEKNVLNGAKNLLGHPQAPIFIIEIHDQENDTFVSDLLSQYGFLTEKLGEDIKRTSSYPYHILAIKQDSEDA